MYVADYNITMGGNFDAGRLWYPYEVPRIGQFIRGSRDIGFWVLLHNRPSNATWRV